MKSKIFIKVIIVLLVVLMLFSLCAATVFAAKAKPEATKKEPKPPRETYTAVVQQIRDYMKPEEKKFWRDGIKELKKLQSYDRLGSDFINNLAKLLEDPANADYAELGMKTLKSVFRMLASCYGAGEISDAIFDNIMNFGEEPQTELMILRDELDKKFDEMEENIDEIQESISRLSNQVDSATREILEGLSSALEDEFSREKVMSFMSGADGNFDYTVFKNYFYGSTDPTKNPLYYDSALYSKAMAIEKSNPEEADRYYSELYSRLMSPDKNGNSYITLFYQHILANDVSNEKSIQRYYYDYLLANRDSLGDKNPEGEALKFTMEMYKSALHADEFIKKWNKYMVGVIELEHGTNPDPHARFVYGDNPSTDYFTYEDLKKSEAAIETRHELLEQQIVSDVAYIFNMAGSVTVAEDGADLFVMTNNDAQSFGNVREGQTVYLNKFNDEWADNLEIDKNLFSYKWYSGDDELEVGDAEFYVSGAYSTFTGAVYYDGSLVYSINFTLDKAAGFAGGDGSVWDPYLISNASQFALIDNGLDKHYKLICDVDFKESVVASMASESDPFTGVLDGNGYSLRNIGIAATDSMGIFTCNAGVICNLTVENCVIHNEGVISGKVYAAVIAAQNLGEITNCDVTASNITVKQVFESTNDNSYAYVAAIAGFSVGSIEYCKVSGTKISLNVLHKYGNASDISNTTEACAAGIAASAVEGAEIKNCAVLSDTDISVFAKAEVDDSFSTRHPYVTARASGIIAGSTYTGVALDKLYSAVKITRCEADRKNIDIFGSSEGNNVKSKSGAYITEPDATLENMIKVGSADSIEFPDKRVDYAVEYRFKDKVSTDYGYHESQIYEVGEKFFKDSALEFYVNGEKLENCVIVSYYFLDTANSDVDNTRETTVELILSATYGEQFFVHRIEIPILIKKNAPSSLEMIQAPAKLTFAKDEAVNESALAEGKFYLVYKDGSTEDVTAEVTASCDTSAYGTAKMTVSYGDFCCTYDVTVECPGHDILDSYVAPTCTSVGYTLHKCKICEYSYKTDVVGMKDHKPVLTDKRDASCTETGFSGNTVCEVCTQLLAAGEQLPKLAHSFEANSSDSVNHFCSCGANEEHIMTAVENEGMIVYYCLVCKYKTQEEGTVSDEAPKVRVSEAYALKGGNRVISVFVDILNNPGINGASFSISYDSRLKLLSYEKDVVLKNAIISKNDHERRSEAYFTFADTGYDFSSGTLLKLYFLVPEDTNLLDEYKIEIGYSRSGVQFSGVNNEAIDLLTLPGKITVVDHLPGDVNGDGSLDILDAVLVARYLSKKNDSAFIKKYANVNLQNGIEITDLTELLQYISGGYGAKIQSNTFSIVLNTNDGSVDFDSLTVDFYKEDGTLGVIGDLPVIQRDGYRFDGWYTKLVGGTRVLPGAAAFYNADQDKQTYYAHYTLNEIKFDGNGATEGSMDSATFVKNGDKVVLANGFVRSSTVEYVSNCSMLGTKVTLNHEFAGWELLDGEGNVIATYSLGDIIELKSSEIGSITLRAVWDDVVAELPVYTKIGYRLDSWDVNEGEAELGSSETHVTLSKSSVISAKWDLIRFTVYYSGNGSTSGTVTDGLAHRSKETEITPLSSNKYKKTGYTFLGWNTSADGSGASYSDGDKLNDIIFSHLESGNTVTFYAQWEANKYNVVYNGNKPSNASNAVAKVPENSVWTYDSNGVISSETPTLVGWIFGGWYKDAACTVSVGNPGSTLTKPNYVTSGEVNLYAKWTPKTYNVTYVANGASGSTATSTHTYDVSRTLTSNGFTRGNYTFLGWSTDSKAVTPTYKNGQSVKNLSESDVTLYAIWVKTKYSVSFSDAHELGRNQSYDETVNPEMDISALAANGYTHLKVTVSFNGRRNAYICYNYAYLYVTSKTLNVTYMNGLYLTREKEGENKSYAHSFALSSCHSNGQFAIKWYAEDGIGSKGDGWEVRGRTITVEAVKG